MLWKLNLTSVSNANKVAFRNSKLQYVWHKYVLNKWVSDFPITGFKHERFNDLLTTHAWSKQMKSYTFTMVITIVLLCTMVTLFSFVTATTAMLYAVFLKMRKTMKKITCWRKYDFYESKIPSPIHPVPSFKKFVCITLEVMHHKQRHMLSIVFYLS